MKKKLTAIITVIAIVIAGLIYLDETFELGVVHKIEVMLDNESPTIDTSSLRQRYLLNEDFTLDVACEDNVDELCEVDIIGDFSTNIIGSFSVTLSATDEKGNVSSFLYNYDVVTHVDGSIYIPLNYYQGIDGLEGDALKQALHNIIKDHVVFPYSDDDETDVWDILREADEDPNNANNVIGIYTGLSIPKDCQQGMDAVGVSCEIEVNGFLESVEWNREHIWSKSRGFPSESFDAYTDAHHLVAAERDMNSTKNNRFFEDCQDGDDDNLVDRDFGNYTCNIWEFEPRDEVKGDIARMILYMAVRYDDISLDLEVIDDPDENSDSNEPIYGDLDDLLRWHIEDPVSEKEILRNEVIYSYQQNRNPFIDMPELVELIWGHYQDYNI